jgi:hypothetical protein
MLASRSDSSSYFFQCTPLPSQYHLSRQSCAQYALVFGENHHAIEVRGRSWTYSKNWIMVKLPDLSAYRDATEATWLHRVEDEYPSSSGVACKLPRCDEVCAPLPRPSAQDCVTELTGLALYIFILMRRHLVVFTVGCNVAEPGMLYVEKIGI